MDSYKIVIDTNVFVSALRSRKGASFKLLSLIKSDKFEVNLSVPLLIEYETAAKRLLGKIPLGSGDIDSILDFVVSKSKRWSIYYLWRPYLKDAGDNMVLEVAITAHCDYIITYNRNDFKGSELFGIIPITPQVFLKRIGEL